MLKYGLALHSTSPQLGISLSNFTDDTRSQTWELGRDLSTHLHQHLIEFLGTTALKDLEFIAVAKGPGSFTGTRLGLVLARTLGQQLNIPIFAISTLAAIAWSEKDKYLNNNKIAIQMDARRSQLFVAIYEVKNDREGLITHLPDTIITPKDWEQTLNSLPTKYQLIETPTKLGNTVTSLLNLAYFEWQKGARPQWSEVLPFYGQHPV
ncbi:MAG: tRNA (adenosine(37)-N6)-threonylcarbamoyltransferase complex dimerization subunit type 1 TsaB [Gomphosphaeria aponina SAG 52.96 = DSM 107014]|uniref:tRNA (Adenosine(37)-N6)-threonylcarbamoyltransferase complex dimerization subunit type 1 TsaB n=1 Tax=Gomphosphaeria aponina SAG 52.96 = DSM 107014 TaxID=1521640 RepID=A0A941GMT6_9CHRO|nr:tRNA (adenosine(37)-N6)-threonylcarbamoyltransferase complex dimerization subunit type 1 TsaB [Gomphosphaeria aponina SAG 52.96 = DSM 107014]